MKDLRNEIKEFKIEMKTELKDLEHRLTIKLGVMLFTSMGIISALISFKQ